VDRQGGGGLVNRVSSVIALAALAAAACKPWATEDLSALGAAPSYSAVSAGGGRTCGLGTDGSAWCWGSAILGTISPTEICEQPYDPIYTPPPVECSSRPIRVSGGHHFVSLSAEGNATLAVDDAGTVWGWGSNPNGLLGAQNQNPYEEYPRPIVGTEGWRFRTISVATSTACGVTDDGRIVCWGEPTLIDGSVERFSVTCPAGGVHCTVAPVQIGTGTSWAEVVVGNEHACARDTGGSVSCWGLGQDGQLGSTPLASCPTNTFAVPCRLTPTPIAGTVKFASLAAEGAQTCGVTTTGALMCWGKGVYTSSVPFTVGASGWKAVGISSGAPAVCAVRTDGTLWCAGQSQLGGFSALRQLAVTASFVGLGVGYQHACARTAAGDAWCFGDRTDGELGDGAVGFQFQTSLVQVSLPYRD